MNIIKAIKNAARGVIKVANSVVDCVNTATVKTLTALGLAGAAGEVAAHAQGYGIATAGTDGTVSFSPGALIVPLMTAAVAIVGSVAGLVLLYKGARMLFRWLGAK
jgi:hypothetical protein